MTMEKPKTLVKRKIFRYFCRIERSICSLLLICCIVFHIQAPIAPKESTEEPMPMEISSGADEEEDISNEAISHRHERMLADERKKFSTFLKFPYSTRSRANRRIDSQSAADSSGANTPDPTSPAPSTPATATNIDQEVRKRKL